MYQHTKNDMSRSSLGRLVVGSLVLILLSAEMVCGQGSIFGNVRNADLSTPGDGHISFFGFLDNTDEEIRVESSVGAGFDAGNWFDDFQNYLTEAPGNPYEYHFFNESNSQGAILSGSIPDNSFQQENIGLAAAAWPQAPAGVRAKEVTASAIVIAWERVSGMTYHVYRRLSSSNGSFFRVDDPSGSPANDGVADSVFTDSSIDGVSQYQYLLVTEDGSGNLSPHSTILDATLPGYVCGDADGNSTLNIADAVYLLGFIFGGGDPPNPLAAGDDDCNGAVNIADVVYMIAFIFGGGPAPCADCP